MHVQNTTCAQVLFSKQSYRDLTIKIELQLRIKNELLNIFCINLSRKWETKDRNAITIPPKKSLYCHRRKRKPAHVHISEAGPVTFGIFTFKMIHFLLINCFSSSIITFNILFWLDCHLGLLKVHCHWLTLQLLQQLLRETR